MVENAPREEEEEEEREEEEEDGGGGGGVEGGGVCIPHLYLLGAISARTRSPLHHELQSSSLRTRGFEKGGRDRATERQRERGREGERESSQKALSYDLYYIQALSCMFLLHRLLLIQNSVPHTLTTYSKGGTVLGSLLHQCPSLEFAPT